MIFARAPSFAALVLLLTSYDGMNPEAHDLAQLAFGGHPGKIAFNHARLASTGFVRQAHFGGFFFSGAGY